MLRPATWVLLAVGWLGCAASGLPDGGADDSGADGGFSDGGNSDGGTPDAGMFDGGADDGGVPDAGAHDGGTWSCPFDVVMNASPNPVFPACDPSLSVWTSTPVFYADGGQAFVTLVHAGRLGGVWALADTDLAKPDDVLTLFELDGGGWSLSPIGMPDTAGHFAGDSPSRFWGSAPNDLWLVNPIWHWDGTHWTSIPNQPFVVFSGTTHTSGTAGDDAWLTDGQGNSSSYSTLYYWDGGSLDIAEQVFQGWIYNAIWADAHGTAFVGEYSGVVHFPDKCSANIGDTGVIWGLSSTDIWAATDTDGGSLYHFDGHTWAQLLNVPVTAIAGGSWNDVWAAAYGPGLLHWDGSTWCQTQGLTDMRVLTAGSGHVWALDGTGAISSH